MKRMQKIFWFACGAAIGFSTVSLAMAAPTPTSGIRETDVRRQSDLRFDSDLQRLADLESRYQETLPRVDARSRMARPLQRVKATSYRSSR